MALCGELALEEVVDHS